MARATELQRWRLAVTLCFVAALLAAGAWLGRIHRAVHRRGGTTVLEEAVAAATTPWQQSLVGAGALAGRRGERATAARGRQDEAASLREQAKENRRLRRLLGLKPPPRFQAVAARVIGRQGWPWASALMLDKGRGAGMRARCVAVAAGRGGMCLVGQITSARFGGAVVLPLLEEGSGAAALVERSRETGIVEGTGRGGLALRYLPGSADVRPGDAVISSGQGTVFPKGIPIGVVSRVRPEPETGLKAADLTPAVDPRLVEEVLVLIPVKAAAR